MNTLKIIFIILIFFSLPLHSQWDALYDETINDFCTMDFVNDSVGWIAGWHGTFLKTIDGGKHWMSMALNPEYDIEDIDFINESTGWAVARSDDTLGYYGTLVLKTEDGGYTWTFQNYLEAQPTKLFALNDTLAFIIAGYQGLYKTSNDSMNCIEISTGLEDSGLGGIWFFDERSGIITGSFNWEYGLILKTYDGGKTWKDTVISEYRAIGSLMFPEDSTGYFLAGNHEGQQFFCTTYDMCRSWSVKPCDSMRILDYQVKGEHIYYAIATGLQDTIQTQYIKRSNDQAISWESLYEIKDWNIRDIFFNGYGEGVAIGSFRGNMAPSFLWGPTSGSVLISNKKDKDWRIEQIVSYPFSDVKFFSPDRGIIAGGSQGFHFAKGGIFLTEDGGNTWQQVYSDRWIIKSVYLVNESIGYALMAANYAGNNIIKTTDGGRTWFEILNQGWYDSTYNDYLSFEFSDIYFLDENSGWLAGRCESDSLQTAVILTTNDGGETWNIEYKDSDVWRFTSIEFSDEYTGWAVSNQNYLYKRIDSVGWQLYESITDLPLRKIYFSDSHNGWITAGYSDYNAANHLWKLYRTSDGGESWQEIPNFNYGVNDILFKNTLLGWAVGFDPNGKGVILKTLDGGSTWITQINELDLPLNAIHFYDQYGWVVGGDTEAEADYPRSVVLKTHDGGSSWINEWRQGIGPIKLCLSQNYPNPFNPSTVISWQLAVSSMVELSVYNLLGEKVATLVSRKLNPGIHTYTFDGKNLASGIYYYQLVAGKYREVWKMVLVR